MTSRWLHRAVIGAALVFLASGCGHGPKAHPVEGVVLLDGAPLEGATVRFFPDGPGEPAVAVTREDGSFALDTQAGKGAQVGTYKVTLTKVTGPPQLGQPPWIGKAVSAQEKEAYFRKRQEIERQQKEWVPKRYLTTATTPLGFAVPVKEKLRLELRSSDTPAGAGN